MQDSGDAELITRAQRGEVNAIGRLYDRHRESIFRYLWIRLDDRPLAEDLTGDVFMRMLDALPRYRAQGLAVSRVAVSHCPQSAGRLLSQDESSSHGAA